MNIVTDITFKFEINNPKLCMPIGGAIYFTVLYLLFSFTEKMTSSKFKETNLNLCMSLSHL